MTNNFISFANRANTPPCCSKRASRFVWVLVLMLTLSVGQMWGTEQTAYTLSGTTTGGTSGYSTQSITQSSKSWKVQGNTQTNPWRIGIKKGSGSGTTDFPIYSQTAISENVTKIVLSHGAVSRATVNSVKIHVYSTAELAAAGGDGDIDANITSSDSWEASSTMTFNKPSGHNWANRFYRIVYNMDYSTTSGSSGKPAYMEFSSAVFKYDDTPATTPTLNLTGDGAFGNVETSSSKDLNFTLTGSYLTANASVSVTGTGFSRITPANGTLTQTSGSISGSNNITVRFAPTTTGSHNGTLTVTSTGATTQTINLTGTGTAPVIKHKAYFYNGSTLLNEGGTEFAEGAAVSYSGSDPESCDTGTGASTTFAGWADGTWDGKVAKNAIVPNFYESTLPVMGDGDVTYHAVFCKAGTSATPTSVEGEISTSDPYLSGTGWATSTAKTYSGPYLRLDADEQNITYTAPSNTTISRFQFKYKLMASTACSGHNNNQWWIGEIGFYGSNDGGTVWTKIDAKSISYDASCTSASDVAKDYADLSSGGYNAIKIQLNKTCGNVGIKDLSATYSATASPASNYMTTCCQPLGSINGSFF